MLSLSPSLSLFLFLSVTPHPLVTPNQQMVNDS